MKMCFVGARCGRLVRILTAVSLFTGLTGSVASAQRSIEVGPFVGYYRPIGHLAQPEGWVDALPTKASDLGGYAVGGDVSFRWRPRFGVRAEAAVSSQSGGQRSVATPGAGIITTAGTTVAVASVQGLFDVLADADRRIWISAGPAFVRHGGDAYAKYGSPSQFAGAAGLGSTVSFAPSLRGTAGASVLVYDLNVPDAYHLGIGSPEHGRQIDLLFHVGLAWAPSLR